MANAIVTENLNAGTTAWLTSSSGANNATTQIQGYVDKTSYNTGDTVTFYVSVQVNATTYTVSIYRIGWYQGRGACLKSTSSTQTGVAQGYYDGTTLQSCPTAIVDSTTKLTEAGWASGYTYAIPSNACTGIYLAVLTDANGKQWYISFCVKSATATDYAYVQPVSTYCAYNNWGGYSLYYPTPGTSCQKVSFNRPDWGGSSTSTPAGAGAGGFLQYEVALVKWLERQGYNVAYLTSVDIHSNASQLLNYNAYLSAGHDEYWSLEMRNGVEAAIAAGVGAGFCGANASYWQIRFATDNAGNANRTVICYKVASTSPPNPPERFPGPNALSADPDYGVDNTRVTSEWRDAVLNRPENTMIGIMFASQLSANVAWTVDANADTTYFGVSGLVKGNSYGYDHVGYEYDKIFSGGPSNLKTIATTSVTDTLSTADTSNTTTYVAASGALVFASGSIAWTWCLDRFRWSGLFNQQIEVPQMQGLFANIMSGLIRNKAPKTFSMVQI